MALAGDVKLKDSKIDELNLGGDAFAGKLNATIKNENLDLNLKEAQLGDIWRLAATTGWQTLRQMSKQRGKISLVKVQASLQRSL
ncbi:hypothetical protein VB002_02090 [Campylobacter concisus]